LISGLALYNTHLQLRAPGITAATMAEVALPGRSRHHRQSSSVSNIMSPSSSPSSRWCQTRHSRFPCSPGHPALRTYKLDLRLHGGVQCRCILVCLVRSQPARTLIGGPRRRCLALPSTPTTLQACKKLRSNPRLMHRLCSLRRGDTKEVEASLLAVTLGLACSACVWTWWKTGTRASPFGSALKPRCDDHNGAIREKLP
jgi:hypothetical protein